MSARFNIWFISDLLENAAEIRYWYREEKSNYLVCGSDSEWQRTESLGVEGFELLRLAVEEKSPPTERLIECTAEEMLLHLSATSR